jgi:hypothetical protein
MRTRISITIIGALAAMALVAVPAASAATDVHTATLQGSAAFPAAKGSAKFSRDDGVKQLEAEVQHVKSLAGTQVRFRVKGILVGTAKVNALGTARIDKSGAAVPAVTTGSRIRVERPNDTLVASGRFS